MSVQELTEEQKQELAWLFDSAAKAKAEPRTFCKVYLKPDFRSLRCRANRVNPISGWCYLAEMDALGHWFLYAECSPRMGLFWSEWGLYVESRVLEQFFRIEDDLLTSEQFDLFGRLIPTDARTFVVKEEIKALGGRWLPDFKAWVLPSDKCGEAWELVKAVGKEDAEEEE